jgi:ketosteroid isomerase-like protein
MPAPAPIDIVRGVYESHERRDTGSLIDLLHPDVRWWQAHNHPYANPHGPWVGIDAVVEHVVEPVNGEWDRFITRVDAMLDAGDHVVVHGAYTGTHRATGRGVVAPVCVVYTVRDGRIVEFRQFVDTAQLRWAMGLTDDTGITPAGMP